MDNDDEPGQKGSADDLVTEGEFAAFELGPEGMPPHHFSQGAETYPPPPPPPLPGGLGGWRSPLSVRETIGILALGFSMVAAGSIAWERVSIRLDHVAELLSEHRSEAKRRDEDIVALDRMLHQHVDSPGHAISMERHENTKLRLEQLEHRIQMLEDRVPKRPPNG